jgi:hypothetical protein
MVSDGIAGLRPNGGTDVSLPKSRHNGKSLLFKAHHALNAKTSCFSSWVAVARSVLSGNTIAFCRAWHEVESHDDFYQEGQHVRHISE